MGVHHFLDPLDTMKRLLFALVLSFSALASHAQIAVCGTPGADGPANAALVVNTYYTIPGALTLAAGSNTLSLGAVPPNDAFGNTFGTLTIEPGDLLLIMQMQDADINITNSDLYGGNNATGGPDALGGTGFTALNNTGRYEYIVTTSSVPLTGGTLTFRGGGAGNGTIYTYTNQDGSATLTQKRFQVIRVPQYSNLTLTSNLVCPPWNGYAGGIVAFDVAGSFAFGGFTISANGRGFRAGYQEQATSGANLSGTYVTTSLTESSGKGENIAGTPRYMWDGFTAVDLGATWNGFPGGDFGRGAPGNGGGGGNDHNSGGGGGANGGSGGVGGIGWEGGGGTWPSGGRPGTQLTQVLGRLFLGGGGGGGDANNALTGVKGGVGGGLVIINAGRIDGTGTITANGDDGDVGAYGSAPDGAGGGGAAGTIFVNATQNSPTANLTLIANGGRGGNSLNDPGFEHGPGGGGGGGAVWHNVIGGAVATSVVKGLSGKANGGAGIAHGAADGQDGVAGSFLFSSLPGYLQGQSSTCYPTLVVTKTSESAQLGVGVPQGDTSTYALVISNSGTGGNAGGVQLDDFLATGITYVSATVAYSGGAAGPGSLTNLGTVSQPRFANFNIPAGGVVTITMTVAVGSAQAPATYQNGAQIRYLDPTRSSADPSRRIAPATNAYSGANTVYETGGATVLGSNYSDAIAGPAGENVLVLAYPVAANDALNMNEDVTLSASLTGGDSDADDALTTLTWSLLSGGTAAANGTLTVNANGTFSYSPNTNVNGSVSFTYRVCDNDALCDDATATITIAALNDAPVILDDAFTVSEDGTITAQSVTGNDSDPDNTNAQLTWNITAGGTAAANGTLSMTAAGAFTYSPNANYNGTVSFTYRACDPSSVCDAATVTITVSAVNDAPGAGDDAFTTNEDASLTSQSLTANDSDPDNTSAQLTWSLVNGGTAAVNGTLTVNATGTFSFAPNANFNGPVSFTYQVCDPSSACDPATVTISVNALNDGPVADDDNFTMAEDGSLNTTLGGNDSDPDHSAAQLTWSLVGGGSAAANGTLTVNANGTFTYAPNTNFTGSVSFTYQLCDPIPLCDAATATISVGSANDAPIAGDDVVGVSEDGTLNTTAAGNDLDPDGDALAFSLVSGGTAATNGSLTFNANGSYSYAPNANFNGVVSFTYEACDPSLVCDAATVTITVSAVNDVPVAGDDSFTTTEDVVLSAQSVAGDDSDPDHTNAQLTYSLVSGGTAATNGTLVFNANGTFTWTPNSNYNGAVTFTYQVCDPLSACDPATVTISVSPVNDAPVANDDSFSTTEDVALTAQSVTGNDSDPDHTNAQLTWSLVSGGSAATNGTLVFNTNGTFTWAPSTNLNGTVAFTYQACDPAAACEPATVTIVVSPQNDPPIAGDEGFSVNEDGSLAAQSLTANDSDPDNTNAQLTWSLVSGGTAAANGVLTVNANGTFSYAPTANYNGTVTFTYQACDPSNACDPATVTIAINAVNDAPVANDDPFTVNEDGTLNNAVSGNDSDVDNTTAQLTWSVLSGGTAAASGSLTFNANGTFTYVPNANFNGSVSFTYQVCDPSNNCDPATATITVTATNDQPVAGNDGFTMAEDGSLTAQSLTANDSDPDHTNAQLTWSLVSGSSAAANGSLTVNAGGTFTYAPNANYNGTVTFTYQVCDPLSSCATATVSIVVTAVNDGPGANDDGFTVLENGTLSNAVNGNDSDVDNTSAQLTWSLVNGGTAAANGSLTVNANGTFTYGPTAGFNGLVSFTYRVCDPGPLCDPATVTIDVGSVNDQPVAGDDAASVNEDNTLNASVTGNDSDPDGDALTYALVSGATATANGTLTFNAAGGYSYVPNANYNGTVSFTYQACDPGLLCDQAVVAITVTAVNDTPIASDDTYSMSEDATLSNAVSGNDSDVEGALNWSLLSGGTAAANGGLVLNSNGTFTYTPNSNYNGAVSFTYQACDAGGLCDPATVTITINAANDAPVAGDDGFTMNEDATLGDVLSGNDSDPETANTGLTWSVVAGGTAAANGSLTVNANGTFTYAPTPNYNGVVSFTYQVCDPANACDPATVTIAINAANDPPIASDDSFAMGEDGALNNPLSGNDSDQETPNSGLVWTLVSGGSAVANGVLTVNANGTFTYAPNVNYNGAVSFTYEVCDPLSACDAATVTITITAVNDVPVANDDGFSVNEDGSLADVLSGNDSDVETANSGLVWSLLSGGTAASNGVLAVNANGSFTYVPSTNFSGAVSFTYQVCDPSSACAPATVTINVNAVNDTPLAVDDAFSMNEDGGLTDAVGGNDSDTETPNNALVWSVVSGGTAVANGTLLFNVDGTFTFTPNANSNGSVSFTYQVCDAANTCDPATVTITIAPLNDAPVALDDNYPMAEDGTLTTSVVGNDSDVDNTGAQLSWTLVNGGSAVANGLLTFNANGSFTYQPDAGFNGIVTFTYQVCDLSSACDNATVTIDVGSANDIPVAADDAAAMDEDGVLNSSVTGNDFDADNDPLTWSLVNGGTAAANGTLVLNANGTFIYTPNANFNGSVSFTYQACDPAIACDQALVVITVNAINDGPIANDDAYFVQEDGVLNANVSGNDSDVDNTSGQLAWGLSNGGTAAANGSLSVGASGAFSFTPNPGFSGTVSFEYQVCDPAPLCGQATVTIVVDAVNDTPEALDDAFTMNEGGTLVASAAINDTDADHTSGQLTWGLLNGGTAAANGVLTFSASGSFTFVPAADVNGTYTFTYQVCDPLGACDVATVTITVLPQNDPPVAQDDIFLMNEDALLNATVTINDNDIDDIPAQLAWTIVNGGSAAANGVLSMSSDGNFSYAPAQDLAGTVAFTYQLCDPGGACEPATVTIIVAPQNDPPVASDDAASTDEDLPVNITITTNDLDVDGNLVLGSITIIAPPTNGSVSIVNGIATYTPNPGITGTDAFIYGICDDGSPLPAQCDQAVVVITINGINDPPQPANDVFSGVEDGGAVTGDLGANDFDPDHANAQLSWTLVSGGNAATNGVLVVNPDATISFTPNADVNGTFSFIYEVCDPDGACVQAVCDIAIAPINDAPVVLDDTDNTPPNAQVTSNVTANDSDPQDVAGGIDPGSVTILVLPVNGTATVNSNGTITYDPALNYTGLDSLQYQVCDLGDAAPTLCATAWFVITVSTDLPIGQDDFVVTPEDVAVTVNVLDNDSTLNGVLVPGSVVIVDPPQYGTAVVNPDGSITYTPDPNSSGVDDFNYQLCNDLGFCSQGTLTVVVDPVNDPPVAGPDASTTVEDTPVIIEVLINDSEPFDVPGDIDPTTVTIVAQPSSGTVQVNIDGTIVYTPNPNFIGVDTLVYQVCDDGTPLPPACDTALVIITVTAVNDAPIITDGSNPADTVYFFATEDEAALLCVSAIDPDGDPYDVTALISAPSFGTVAGLADGDSCFTYSPDPNFSGIDTLIISVCDDLGACDFAVAIITVFPVNDPPVVIGPGGLPLDTLLISTPEDTPIDQCFTAVDPDGDVTGISLVLTGPFNGIVGGLFDGDSCLTYIPSTNYYGPDTMQVLICDGFGGCDTVVVVIDVTPVNDDPVITDGIGPVDTINVNAAEDTPLILCLPVVDVDGDTVDVTDFFAGPQNGTMSDIADGDTCFIYTPNIGFNGTDSVNVIVTDGNGGADTALVVITVSPVNDAPVIQGPDTLSVSTNEDEPLTLCLTAIDPEGDAVDVTAVSGGPLNGTVNGLADGDTCFTYIPGPDFNSTDTFTVILCDALGACDSVLVVVEVVPVNDDPVITDAGLSVDTIYTTIPEGIALIICPEVTDADGDALDLSDAFNGPQVGSVSGISDGDTCFTYSPAPGYQGNDTVTVVITDGNGGADTVVVVISVTEPNAPPIIVDGGGTPLDTLVVTVDEDGQVVICPEVIDPNGDPVSVTQILNGPLVGTATNINDGDTCFTYIPIPNVDSGDTLTVVVCDPYGGCDTALVIIDILPVNDAPVITDGGVPADTINTTTQQDAPLVICLEAVDLESDTLDVTGTLNGPSSGAISGLADGDTCITYTPDPGFSGNDTLTVVLCDVAGACDTVVVVITVDPVNPNAPPIAVDDAATTGQDVSVTIDVQANDSDPDGDPLTTSSASAANGTVVINPDGTITYTPPAGWCGTDTITYVVCDPGPFCDTAIVVMVVDCPAQNDPPIAVDDNATTDQNTNVTIDPLVNDSDPNGDPIIITSASAANGTVVINGNGTITYTPASGFCGTDTITYTICDPGPLCDQGIIVVTVECPPVNDPPIAVDDSTSLDQGGSVIIDVLNNDSDPNGDPITVTDASAGNGTVEINLDGFLNYTPDPGFCGVDTITYTICDPGPLCDVGLVFVTVLCAEVPLLIPQGFSPNGDGFGDTWVIQGLETFPLAGVTIINRWGNTVYVAAPYTNDWDGRSTNGLTWDGALPAGTYWYLLDLGVEGEEVRSGYIYLNK